MFAFFGMMLRVCFSSLSIWLTISSTLFCRHLFEIPDNFARSLWYRKLYASPVVRNARYGGNNAGTRFFQAGYLRPCLTWGCWGIRRSSFWIINRNHWFQCSISVTWRSKSCLIFRQYRFSCLVRLDSRSKAWVRTLIDDSGLSTCRFLCQPFPTLRVWDWLFLWIL
jgi:hypothetical protein